ncbi:MAG TPA: AMP-binding protein [Burkholderiaceae bacterium]|nr:AMP-binding protein [Burkholderiaceae bacterium]
MSTVHALFARTAARTPHADFVFTDAVTASAYGIGAGALSWADAAAQVEALLRGYAAAGYGHGHRVGLQLENRPAFLLHWFALNALGVSVVPIHAELRSTELHHLFGHSEIVLAVTLPPYAAALQNAAAGVLAAPPIWVVGRGALPPPSRPAPRCDEPVDGGSECALLYTSGTTGRPKGCMLSNGYFLDAGRWYANLGHLCAVRPDAERVITPLPLTHMNAMAFSTMVVLTAGGCLIQLDRFHPGSWWRSVRESGATIVHYLGVMPAMLLTASPSNADSDHAVRIGFGAGVDRSLHAAFEARFGFPLLEAWAMTETGSAACVMAHREPRHVGTNCFGRADATMRWRLVDDAGDDVTTGEPGELLVRAAGADPRHGFFSGYLKDDATTEEAWAGGWFHTGDVVRADGDGNLYFVDRKKNVIRRSGENISAVEVESVLNQHPLVQASAVAATPDALRGDEVLACVVTRQPVRAADRAAVAASLVEHALWQLAYFKAPGYVAFVDALPLTSSQKIQRGELKTLAARLPGQSHCIDVRSLKRRPL